MYTQLINTNPLAKVNWRSWDELEKLTGTTKRLTMRLLVLDKESDEYKKLTDQHKKAFLRMADLLIELSGQQ